ncbi:ABC transporter substrate-binding protein [Pigmentiphaga sp.]|uniref:ABC transporter substrate-binding protein n=1 Tax=Pigmentiphaga sp. TaxID=1977564 RepID=UPI0025E51931|nr:ABC transporter substrate-binding protein [Pigmentiphaga sp.]
MAIDPLRVAVFDGGWNLPLWAGIDQGFFASHGVPIELHYVGGSAELVEGLLRDEVRIAIAGIDNLVAYQEGHARIPGTRPDLVAFLGGDRGFLSLVAAPGIQGYDDLRGRTLSVDALSTGFAFVLRELLATHGIPAHEVEIVPAGGTSQRYAALLAGRHAATLLRTPYELLAQEAGCRILPGAAWLDGYMGSAAFCRRAWAATSSDTLRAFARAYRTSLDWLVLPDTGPRAAALLREHARDLDPALSERARDVLLAPGTGLIRDLRPVMAGIATVLALRNRHAGQAVALRDPARYVDLGYLPEI